MSTKENIKRLRESRNLTQAELGEIAGVTDKAVSTWERGDAEPRMGAIEKMAKYFGVRKSDIYGDDVDQRRIPILGTVAGGEANEIFEYKIGELDLGTDDGADYFALRISGDSMSPRIMDGDKVVVRKQTEFENGDIVIVAVNGYEATCKKILKSEKGITLVGTNTDIYMPHFYSKEEVETLPVTIIGKVVHVIGDV